MTTYQPNIPTGLVNLDVDYRNIQQNFSQLDTSFGINHFTYSNATANNGKHTFVQMVKSTVIPAGLSANEGTLYTKTPSSVTNLYYSPDNSSKEYQMTATDTANFNVFGTNTVYPSSPANPNQKGGWTFLPGGLILQYGTLSSPGSSGTIKFPKAFATGVYSINISFSRTGGSTTQQTRIDSFSSANLTGFDYSSTSSNNDPILWMAIGL